MTNLHYALRSLRQSPAFTAIAVLTLALGIGATTTVFSVANAVLLTPPPFEDAGRLEVITARGNERVGELPLSYPTFDDLRSRTRAFESVGAWTPYGNTAFSLTGAGEPERVPYAMGSASLFSVLRVKPMLGRTFTAAEDQFGSAGRVAMLSAGLWRRRFGGDSAIIGRTITLDGVGYAVVGVLPPSFNFVAFPTAPGIWIPLAADPVSPNRHYGRGVSYLGVIGRLKPGVTPAAATADLHAVSRQLEQENAGLTLALERKPLGESISGPLGSALLVLLGAVGLVLLIACANVANLQLARGTSRERETIVRLALGADRARLVIASLTESAVLAVAGATGGVLFALWGVSAFGSLPIFGPPAPLKPYAIDPASIPVDLRVLGFALVVCVLTGLVFGVIPAIHLTRGDLDPASRLGVRGGAQRRISRLLVVSEIAIAVVLLMGAGLLIHSLARLSSVDPGFRTERILTVDLSLPAARYPDGVRRAAFYQTLLERVPAIPGVESAGVTNQPPLGGPLESTDFRIAGEAPPADATKQVIPYTKVSPDYFRTVGMSVTTGRGFAPGDVRGAPSVAIVSAAMAERYWPGANPIGKRFTLSTEALRIGPRGQPSFQWDSASREVVGVVGDIRHEALAEPPVAEVYLPFAQAPEPTVTLTVRTAVDPATVAASVGRAVHDIDPDQPVGRIATMRGVVATATGEPRFRAALLGLFASLALMLAAIGIYGVMSYAVSQRTREIGIRAALGAGQRQLVAMVLREGLVTAALGVGIGLGAGALATRALASQLYGVSPGDPVTYAAVTMLLVTVTLTACYLPARRAAQVDPVEALRRE